MNKMRRIFVTRPSVAGIILQCSEVFQIDVIWKHSYLLVWCTCNSHIQSISGILASINLGAALVVQSLDVEPSKHLLNYICSANIYIKKKHSCIIFFNILILIIYLVPWQSPNSIIKFHLVVGIFFNIFILLAKVFI